MTMVLLNANKKINYKGFIFLKNCFKFLNNGSFFEK